MSLSILKKYNKRSIKGVFIGQISLFKDSFWTLVGSILGYGLSLVSGIILAKYMGGYLYGEYGMIKNTLLYISIFSTFGLGITSVKFISQYKNVDETMLAKISQCTLLISSVISFILGLFVFVFAHYLSVLLKAEDLVVPLRITAVVIFFNAVTTAQAGILSGLSQFKKVALIRVLFGIFVFAFSLFLYFYLGFNGAIYALLISYILQFCISQYYIVKCVNYVKLSIKDIVTIVKSIVSFSLPITLQEAAYAITHWLSLYILVTCLNYRELGVYSAASQWVVVILFIPNVLRSITLSYLSGTFHDLAKHRQTLFIMLLIGVVSTLIPSIIVILFSSYIGSIYGESFTNLDVVLKVLAFSTVFDCAINILIQEYISINKQWFISICKSVFDILIPVLTYFLISAYSETALSLAIANLVVKVVLCFVLFFDYKVRIISKG